MLTLAGASVAALLAWLVLTFGRGWFWRTDQLLPDGSDPVRWPAVLAVVPARDEAENLPGTLPALLGQRYPGSFRIVVVDDESGDGTFEVAASAMGPDGRRAEVVRSGPRPDGWAGKVWAMARGLKAAEDEGFVLLVDADIALGPEVLTELVRAAEGSGRDLVSQMARLHVSSGWERALVPAFVYFFAQLYPFRWVNRPSARTAAAAGGCMLVRLEALRAAGGLASIRGALIDDVSLARLLKRRPGRIWLGHGGADVVSVREHGSFEELWRMVSRSADTQLRHSLLLLGATVLGLALVYAVPPIAALAGLIGLAAGAGLSSRVASAAGLAGWALMAVSYAPTLRLYRLGWVRGLALPIVAVLYTGMTVDSAIRHRQGRGGEWKGRTTR